MEKRMLIITKNSEIAGEAIWCSTEKHAQGMLEQMYYREIRKSRYLDMNNTYITDERDYAHIQNGLEEIFIRICRTKQYGKRAKKKYKYKKRKRDIKTKYE